MNKFKLFFLLIAVSLMSFSTMHKFYVSVTQIDYIEDKGELQIISRIFIDDLEKLIRERYDENVTLAGDNEPEEVNTYIEKYLSQKINITINGEGKELKFLGKEYEDDIALCYLEISGIKSVNSIEITNTVLFELFEEQQNIIKTKINSKRKSFILIQENDKGLLNFN
jgi:hypothetical protein